MLSNEQIKIWKVSIKSHNSIGKRYILAFLIPLVQVEHLYSTL